MKKNFYSFVYLACVVYAAYRALNIILCVTFVCILPMVFVLEFFFFAFLSKTKKPSVGADIVLIVLWFVVVFLIRAFNIIDFKRHHVYVEDTG